LAQGFILWFDDIGMEHNDLPFPQNIFMLQTRPETVWSEQEAKPLLEVGKGPVDYVIDFMMAGGKITGEKRWGRGQ